MSGSSRTRAPVLAVDLGGTHLRVAAVSEDGAVVARRHVRTPLDEGADAVVARASELLRDVEAGLTTVERGRLRGVGVSAPGPLDPRSGVLIDPPNLGPTFRAFRLAEALADATGRRTFVERDTLVAALAEGRFGAAQGSGDYLYLTVSTGVGGAIVSAGHLVTGPDGTAGELGHLPVDLDGPQCGCGAVGHLEAIASGTGIARAARRAVDSGSAPALAAYAARRAPAEIEAADVAAAEEAGDATAAAILDYARRAFAAVVVGLVDVFDPDLIVVGGGVARGQAECLLRPARESIARFAFQVPAARVRVVPAALGDDVGLIGALPLVDARLRDAYGTATPA